MKPKSCYVNFDQIMQIDNTDNTIWTVLDVMLIILASSTLAYEIALFSKLPIWACYPFFAIATGVQLLVWFRSNTFVKAIKIDKNILGLVVLGVFCLLFNVLVLRPDADDFSFFHRALYGVLHLDDPIATFHTAHDIKNLPSISPVHLTTSIEVMTALLAHVLGIQPLFFYQILTGSLCLFLLPFVYYVFYRYFGFSHNYSYIGVVIVIFLYIFSGDSHQDWGNFTLVRAWQGKCILIYLFVPLTALLTYRYMQFSSLADILRLHLAAICSIGLSGTAFFLIPFIIGSVLISSTLTQWHRPEYFRKVKILAFILVPFALIASLIKLGFLPEVLNTDVWKIDSIPNVNKDIRPEILMLERTIFVTKITLYFYLIAVLGLLFLPWKNNTIKELGIASLFVCVALVLPPVSSILIKITLPGAYWRLAYATQMPFIIGIFVLLCFQGLDNIRYCQKTVQRILGISFLAVFAMLKSPVIKPELLSKPHSLKFNLSEIEVAEVLKNWIPNNSTALIPGELVSVVGLMFPRLDLVTTRAPETLHVFINAGRKNEAEVRLAAQQDLINCGGTNGKVAQIVSQISSLNLLIFPITCSSNVIESNAQIHKEDWKIKSTTTYQIWLKNAQ